MTTVMSIKLPKVERDQLEQLSKQEDRSMANMLRFLIRQEAEKRMSQGAYK